MPVLVLVLLPARPLLRDVLPPPLERFSELLLSVCALLHKLAGVLPTIQASSRSCVHRSGTELGREVHLDPLAWSYTSKSATVSSRTWHGSAGTPSSASHSLPWAAPAPLLPLLLASGLVGMLPSAGSSGRNACHIEGTPHQPLARQMVEQLLHMLPAVGVHRLPPPCARAVRCMSLPCRSSPPGRATWTPCAAMSGAVYRGLPPPLSAMVGRQTAAALPEVRDSAASRCADHGQHSPGPASTPLAVTIRKASCAPSASPACEPHDRCTKAASA